MANRKNRKITAVAPGRVCLFGDHQDYLGLPIIACAINRFVKVVGIENTEAVFNFMLPDIEQEFSIDYKTPFENLKKGDHFLSALKVLKRYNCIPDRGFDITISGNIPINAGLSSSSAVVVAWVRFLIEAFGIDGEVTPDWIAQLAYEAEVVEMNSSGGKMDQFSIAIGHIIYLETDKDSNFAELSVPKVSLIIGESGVPKATLEVLKTLKNKTWKAIDFVQKNVDGFTLKSAQVSDLPKYLNDIPKELHGYLSAAIKNHDVTLNALKELTSESFNLTRMGELMDAHHAILKDKLSLTVGTIDAMIEAAKQAGALGAKIVGSGRGGCIVALCNKNDEFKVIESLLKAGAKDAYKVSITGGARILKN